MQVEALVSLPSPVAAPRSEKPDRDLWCRRYDDCLDVAVAEGWDGFACGACAIRGTDQVFPAPPQAEGNWAHAESRPGSKHWVPTCRVKARPTDVTASLAAGPAALEEIAALRTLTIGSLRSCAERLVREGRIRRRGDGRYELTGGKRRGRRKRQIDE